MFDVLFLHKIPFESHRSKDINGVDEKSVCMMKGSRKIEIKFGSRGAPFCVDADVRLRLMLTCIIEKQVEIL